MTTHGRDTLEIRPLEPLAVEFTSSWHYEAGVLIDEVNTPQGLAHWVGAYRSRLGMGAGDTGGGRRRRRDDRSRRAWGAPRPARRTGRRGTAARRLPGPGGRAGPACSGGAGHLAVGRPAARMARRRTDDGHRCRTGVRVGDPAADLAAARPAAPMPRPQLCPVLHGPAHRPAMVQSRLREPRPRGTAQRQDALRPRGPAPVRPPGRRTAGPGTLPRS